MNDWGFAAGYLRSLKNDLINMQELHHLSETADQVALLKALEETGYSEAFNAGNIAHYEDVFENRMRDLFEELQKIIPNPVLLDIHRLSLDINNIKIVYKAKVAGKKMQWETLDENGMFASEDIYTIIEEKLYFKLHPELDTTLKEMDLLPGQKRGLQWVDFMLDKALHETRYRMVSEDPELVSIEPLLSMTADFENIKNALRAKRLKMELSECAMILLNHGIIDPENILLAFSEDMDGLIDYFKSGPYGDSLDQALADVRAEKGFSSLERAMDESMMWKLNAFVYKMNGPEVVEEFIRLKKMEIKNLKIVFIGKLNEMPVEDIKMRLRRYAV